ncbi:MAG: hypothetical protein CMM94_02565 [Rickettsiales bacterium]|nr:hypothetical protein [Rickettsiales bacterium]
MITELKLTEMLCTRLCHDLTGPIGAVNNGIEFMQDDAFDMQDQALELIVGSAQEASNRLQFYRQAYGRINESGEADLQQLRSVAEAFFSTSKISLDWADQYTDPSVMSVSMKMGRLLLNLMIISAGSLLKGGSIVVKLESDQHVRHVEVIAQGDVVKLDEECHQLLRADTPVERLTPKTSQPYLTKQIVKDLVAELTVELSDGALRLVVEQKDSLHNEQA